GTPDRALLENPGPPWRARTPRQAPEVDGATLVTRVPAGARPGDFTAVRYTTGAGCDLRAVAATQKTADRSQ
ncbi:MAG: hypothetical protein JW951_05600, partial [Lentisphaerae bacterium]|nr:hypothetical protein [Lentisphaerota bacterium]